MPDSLQTRIRQLNNAPHHQGRVVVYAMSRDQRFEDNHALLAAADHAAENDNSLLVVFNVYPTTGQRNHWHYQFMFSGLKQVEQRCHDAGISFSVLVGQDWPRNIAQAVRNVDASAVYCDFNPLRRPRNHRTHLAQQLDIPVYEVDTHNIVPLWVASNKQETAARTIRPKIHSHLEDYLHEPGGAPSNLKPAWKLPSAAVSWQEAEAAVDAKRYPGYSPRCGAGEQAAHDTLQDFLNNRLEHYASQRNDMTVDGLSGLSPYFHFGQLSPLRAVLAVREHAAKHSSSAMTESKRTFIEEAVVRRELSDNFCYYNDRYDSLAGASDWAQDSLAAHATDPREYVYSFEQFEQAQTHDHAWNAAQRQLTQEGKVHGYMRMYWAKKFLEWTESPQTALAWAIKLNDRYSVDGQDPNGYVGVMWSIAGVHDRGWAERDIFGKIRYMNYNGLKRKFDINSYIERYS